MKKLFILILILCLLISSAMFVACDFDGGTPLESNTGTTDSVKPVESDTESIDSVEPIVSEGETVDNVESLPIGYAYDEIFGMKVPYPERIGMSTSGIHVNMETGETMFITQSLYAESIEIYRGFTVEKLEEMMSPQGYSNFEVVRIMEEIKELEVYKCFMSDGPVLCSQLIIVSDESVRCITIGGMGEEHYQIVDTVIDYLIINTK